MSVPRSDKQPRQYLRVAESLIDNPEFIKVRFHIGRFVMAIVDTEADRTNIKVPHQQVRHASTCLNVSII
jgi:hypothetical protein